MQLPRQVLCWSLLKRASLIGRAPADVDTISWAWGVHQKREKEQFAGRGLPAAFRLSNVPWRPMVVGACSGRGELGGDVAAVRGGPAPRVLKRSLEVQTQFKCPAPTARNRLVLFPQESSLTRGWLTKVD